jgi:hypothetical protein
MAKFARMDQYGGSVASQISQSRKNMSRSKRPAGKILDRAQAVD